MSYFADDAHWGALTGLTQGVVPQDPGQQGHGGLLLGADVYKRQAEHIDP